MKTLSTAEQLAESADEYYRKREHLTEVATLHKRFDELEKKVDKLLEILSSCSSEDRARVS